MTDEEYKASRPRFGEWYESEYLPHRVPRMDPEHGQVVGGYVNGRGQEIIIVRLKHGICPCAECGHAGGLMKECDESDGHGVTCCQDCCGSLCS